MKTEKMSFKNIKDVLSRDEMKKIMAGSGGGSGDNSCDSYTCPLAGGGSCARNTDLKCACNDGKKAELC